MGLLDKLFRRRAGVDDPGVIDLRSDEYKKMEREVAEETGMGSQELDALAEELVVLVQQFQYWLYETEDPTVRSPMHPRIREIGEQINELAGYRGMQRACLILKARIQTRDGTGKTYPADSIWRGIGDWIP